ncbi:MAG: ferritin-like domain-containing protein, partial [Actinobacteria bacterium]|nr:ferritin-like domain-containing protein [Actinomycetota bacterium]
GLEQAIKGAGGTPAKKPTFKFPVTNQKQFLALASVLENTGVSAYNGQGPKLQNKAYLATAGAIVQIEARHAAAINYMIGLSPTPDGGFDKPLEMAPVLKAVKPLIAA